MRSPTASRSALIFLSSLIALLASCQSLDTGFVAVASPVAAQPTDAATPTPTPAEVSSADATATSEPLPPPDVERDTDQPFSLVDRPDDSDEYQLHFFYAVPSDSKDDLLDVNGQIALSAAAMNTWLEGQTGHRLRYDNFDGALDVTYLPLEPTADEINELDTRILVYIEHEIKARGFDPSHKLFIVYYDGFFTNSQGYCGLASYPPDGAGQTAVLLLRGYNPNQDYVCPRQFTKSETYTGYFEMTILHETLHLLGMVPSCAPHNDDGHVNDNSQDLMYFQYDGSYSPLYTYLDRHNDDYYNHGNPDCPDLARSVFLDPLPEGAEPPPGWDTSSRYSPPNPLEAQ